MSDHPAHLFLVQFSPSPARAERLNVGLILVRDADSILDFRMDSKAGERASAIHREPWTASVVDAQCASLASRLADVRNRLRGPEQVLQAVKDVAGRLANELVVSGPHRRIVPPGSAAFDALFEDLVAAPAGKRSPRTPAVSERLSLALESAGVLDLVQKQVDLEVELLGSRHMQRFPYAYQNGALHCLYPERYSGTDKASLGRLSLTVDLAQALDATAAEGSGARLAVYAAFDSAAAEEAARKALARTNARIWRAGPDDADLAGQVRAAHAQHS